MFRKTPLIQFSALLQYLTNRTKERSGLAVDLRHQHKGTKRNNKIESKGILSLNWHRPRTVTLKPGLF